MGNHTKSERSIMIVLDNIRSTYNVGAIFRTADAVGVTKIYITGYTPAPIDRFGRPVPEIAKTALGAEQSVSWQRSDDPLTVVQQLQNTGTTVVAVEQDAKAMTLYEYTPDESVAYVLGNEIVGVSPAVCRQVDAIVEIPMVGEKESLNVSVSAGIVLYNHTQKMFNQTGGS